MSKLLIDNISRSEELCNELAMLEQKKQKLQAELEELQEKCEHSIIIVTKVNPGYAIRAKCLFCGEHYTIPHQLREIPNHITLEAWTYEKLKHIYSDREIYRIITNKAKEFLKENPTMTSKKLAQQLENFFK